MKFTITFRREVKQFLTQTILVDRPAECLEGAQEYALAYLDNILEDGADGSCIDYNKFSDNYTPMDEEVIEDCVMFVKIVE